MLILTRRIGETIKIGHDIEVTVLAIKGNQVRCGITAPPTTQVHREEIYDKIQNGELPLFKSHVPTVSYVTRKYVEN